MLNLRGSMHNSVAFSYLLGDQRIAYWREVLRIAGELQSLASCWEHH